MQTSELEKREEELLRAIKSIKKKHCGSESVLRVEDATDYENGLLLRLRREKSPTLRLAITTYLETKTELSVRSRAEYGTYLKKMVKKNPLIAEQAMATVETEQWQTLLKNTYPTAAGRNKARKLLHGMCEYATAQAWIAANPIGLIPVEPEQQKAPSLLSQNEIQNLLQKLQEQKYFCLASAIGFILWQGTRICELKRMRWEHIQRFRLTPVLQQWLKMFPTRYQGPILPANWVQKWRQLRRELGIRPQQSDTLRYTFAAYHLCFFQSPHQLAKHIKRLTDQKIEQLYTEIDRYNISRSDAEAYWNGTWWQQATSDESNE